MRFRSKKPGKDLVARTLFCVRLLVFFVVLSLNLYAPNFAQSAAGVPMLVNFQGRLLDSSGNLLGGAAGTDYCFKFSIYDATTAGSKIWPTGSPTPGTLTVREGVFDATIGSADTLDLTFTDDQAYVEVAVSAKSGTCDVGETGESYETLTPRPQIVSSGFAINSKTVGGFTPAQSATNSQIPVLTSGAIILGHATTAGLTSSGTAPLAVDGGASGALNLNNTSTGDILLGGGSGSTGCTLTNSTGAFACSAGLTSTTYIGTSSITNTGSLADINVTLVNDADADVISGINIDATSAATGADGDSLYGVHINNLTSADADVTETALRVGTGWDNIFSNGTYSLTSAGVLTVASCTGCGASGAWNSLTAPTGDQTLTFDAGEQNIWTMNSTTDNFWSIASDAITTGTVFNLTHATSVIANGGSLVRLTSTGVDTATTTGALLDLSSTASTAGTQFLQTYSGLTTGIGQSIVADALTTGEALNISHSTSVIANGGSVVKISSTSNDTATNTGALLYLSSTTSTSGTQFLQDYTGITDGIGQMISANSLTTGTALKIPHNNSVIADGGSLVRLSSTSIDTSTTTGSLLDLSSTASTDGTQFLQTYSALTTGTAQSIQTAALTSGSALKIAVGSGVTGGRALQVTASGTSAITNGLINALHSGAYTGVGGLMFLEATATTAGTVATVKGTALTTGIGLQVTGGGATALTTGNVLNVTGPTGAAALSSTTGGVVNITASGAYTSSNNAGLLNLNSGTATGRIQSIVTSALTTGTALLASHSTSVIAEGGSVARFSSSGANTGVNVGTILDVANTGASVATSIKFRDTATTTGSFLNVSHATSVIASGGSVARVSSTTNDTGTTTGVLLDLSSTASTTGVQFLQTYSALTNGTGQHIVANALTTGEALKITHTTGVIANGGSLIRMVSNSADTSTTTGSLIHMSSTASTAGTQFTQTFSGLTTGIGQSMVTDALTTGQALSIDAGNTMTTGSALSITGTTYVHGTETGSLASLAFTDSTTAAVTSTTNGLLVSPTIDASSGAATRTINGISVAPAFTACAAGTCAVNGVNIGNVTDGTGFTGVAVNIGTGWDTVMGGTTAGTSLFDFTNFDVLSTGAVTTGTWNATDISLADGGTNASLTASNGGIFYSTATAGAILSGTATAGLALVSGASTAPSWFTPTTGSVLFAGTGGILQQDNTNFFFNDTTNNFGLGTATPLTRLDVAGNVRTTGKATAVLTGSIDPIASTTVTGVSTLFTTELVIGDRITVNAETRTVTAIASDTSLTVDTAFTDTLNDTSPDVLYALHTAKLSSGAIALTLNDLGSLGINTVAPNRKLDVLDASSVPQLRLSQSASVYGELYLDASGDLKITDTGKNVRITDGDLFVCAAGGCASTDPTGEGSLVVETGIKLDSGATLAFANTDVVLTHSTGILTMGTGDLRVTTAGTNTASVVTVGGTQTLTGKTLTIPVIGGTAASAGQLGRDATQQMLTYYDNGQIGTVSKTLAVGNPAESLTNSVTTDQDFTSIFTIPANYLTAGKILRVTIGYQFITGVSSATNVLYVKLGTTKVIINGVARNHTDSVTRNLTGTFYIYGTAAAGAAVNVESAGFLPGMAGDVTNGMNSVTQPVALATNGTLAITPGTTYSATGSTETVTLRTYLIEELN